MHAQRTKTVGTLALTTLVVSAGLAFGLWYLLAEKRDAFTDHLEARAQARATNQQLDALAELVRETKAERDELGAYLITEHSVIDFLTHIEETAQGVGVTIETQSLAVAPFAENAAFEALTLTVLVTGSYEAVTHVLELFESLPYQVAIDSVTLESNEGAQATWSGTYTMHVTKEPAS